MNNAELDLLLENQSLKFEFARRKLDLDAVFFPTPDDLTRENRALRHLLDWVEKYTTYRDRNRLEAEGYHFPPISPGISPEEDWYRFKEWIHGHPLRAKLKSQLLVDYVPKAVEQLTTAEVEEEIRVLTDHLASINVQVELEDELPLGLLYEHLVEMLEDEFDILVSGMWHLDGCTGYCPGCFQRPWCDFGQTLCWREDEEAGTIALIDVVQKYVSPSPIALQLLQQRQAAEDQQMGAGKQNNDELPF